VIFAVLLAACGGSEPAPQEPVGNQGAPLPDAPSAGEPLVCLQFRSAVSYVYSCDTVPAAEKTPFADAAKYSSETSKRVSALTSDEIAAYERQCQVMLAEAVRTLERFTCERWAP
jgi:hypothetical protein